jgi:integrase/recombinase XerD
LGFVEAKIGKTPTAIAMTDLDATLILNFLDYLEKGRKNAVRSQRGWRHCGPS